MDLVRPDRPCSPPSSQSSTACRTVYVAEVCRPRSSSACAALSLSRTSACDGEQCQHDRCNVAPLIAWSRRARTRGSFRVRLASAGSVAQEDDTGAEPLDVEQGETGIEVLGEDHVSGRADTGEHGMHPQDELVQQAVTEQGPGDRPVPVREQVLSGSCLSLVTASTRSPSSTVVLVQAGFCRVVEATYLAVALIRSAYSPSRP